MDRLIMKMKNYIYTFTIIIIILVMNSCVEPFNIESISYERILVVEGRLTNELKKHEIHLSRTIPLDSIVIEFEKNASVFVIDDTDQIFNFSETEDGEYLSDNPFIPNLDNTYTLKIELADGSKYSSTVQKLTGTSQIDDITASIDENNLGTEKININVNAFSTNDNVNHYYYEYEETNEMSAPFYGFFEIDFSLFPAISLVSKNPLTRFCYNTVPSSGGRLQTETLSLAENKISNFTIRSINTNDIILARRYSILVKQYTQSFDSYIYHETLNNFTNFESIFSENQVGFIKGNIFNENNSDENVIGFFEVNSVTSERLFFNRNDFFNSPSPYPVDCNVGDFFPIDVSRENGGQQILDLYSADLVLYNIEDITDTGYSFIFVPRDCGDCSNFGNLQKPNWWID